MAEEGVTIAWGGLDAGIGLQQTLESRFEKESEKNEISSLAKLLVEYFNQKCRKFHHF